MVRTELVTGNISKIDICINDMIAWLENDGTDLRIKEIQLISFIPATGICRCLIVYETED